MSGTESCPAGTEMAGKASACEGCPSRNICASGTLFGETGPDPDVAKIASCLQDVKNKVVILSGKGGVGKSTVSSLLARSLAKNEELEIGLLDIDITGPSQPLFMGVKNEEVHKSASGWTPVYADENLAVMSAGFLLAHDAALVWGGARKNGLLKNFLKEVEWGALDYLLIDSPPGTSDEHMSTTSLLKDAGITGAVIVTTPSKVALIDVQRQLAFCQKVDLKILGLIENMAGFVCPKCTKESEIFRKSDGGVEEFCEKNDVAYLGALPIDPKICQAMDTGENPMDIDSPAITKLNIICDQIQSYCQTE
ncbi:unnamed protein product [Oikopleura dioica]|uniref:AAA+ ATPase domain-containing protein n=1 Tax=Oikopleura dioica TaxID=34765 RepID=E4WVH4_OIKDI|nr:unnamed protein product [Oikopleura dioica]